MNILVFIFCECISDHFLKIFDVYSKKAHSFISDGIHFCRHFHLIRKFYKSKTARFGSIALLYLCNHWYLSGNMLRVELDFLTTHRQPIKGTGIDR